MDDAMAASQSQLNVSGAKRLRVAWARSAPGLSAIAVFSIFINLLRLAIPIYVLQLLDRVIASGSMETLIMLSVITLVAIVSGALLEATRRKLFLHWGNWIEGSLGPTLFTTGMQQGGGNLAAGTTRLRDVSTLKGFVASKGLIAWLDFPWAAIFIACVFLVSPTLGWILAVGALLALMLGAANEFLTREARNANRRAGDEARDWISVADRERETVGSLKTVQSLARKWADKAATRQDENLRSRKVHINFLVTIRLIGQLVRIGMLGTGIWLVINDSLSLGAVVAGNILGRTAYMLVQDAMLRWRDLIRARKAYGRVKRSLNDEKAPVVSRSSSAKGTPLTLHKLAFRHHGQSRSLLQSISLTLEPGEMLYVVGASASGKSTFCRLVGGVLEPGSGSIRLGDVDVHRLRQNSLDREVGYLPQEITLFKGTVRENIASMEAGDIDQVVDAARLAGIHDAIVNLPAGYDTEIEDREPLLSAGQRKCLAIARAFYGHPPLVILDEPFPHLDYRTKKALLNGIASLMAEGVMVILTHQRQTSARRADKAILLADRKYTLLNSKEEIVGHLKSRRGSRSNRAGRNRARSDEPAVADGPESTPDEPVAKDGVIRPRFGQDG